MSAFRKTSEMYKIIVASTVLQVFAVWICWESCGVLQKREVKYSSDMWCALTAIVRRAGSRRCTLRRNTGT